MPSSVVRAMQYDEKKMTLRIIYVSGMIYDYKKVPPDVVQSMKKAFSKGVYLNEHIKRHYEFEKIQ